MSDNMQNPMPASTAETANSAEASETVFETLDDIEKRYFSPDEVAGPGGEYFAASAELTTLITNFDMSAEMGSEAGFPDGYGLAVIPISQRTEAGKNETVAVVAAAVPTLDMILSAEGGRDFVDDLVNSALMTKIANAARPRPGQTGVPILPRTLADFMEGGRRESIKGFTEIAPLFVKRLKAKGMKNINPAMLRECIQSTAIAKQYFPNVSQENWIRLANGVVQLGEAKKLDMSVVKHWIETRDEAGARVIDDSVLADVLAGLGAE